VDKPVPKYSTDKLRTNIPKMLFAVIGFILVVAYGTVSLSAQDLTWFLTGFDARPERVVVYRGGQRTEFPRGDPGFDRLAEAVRASLASGVTRPSGIGMSADSLQDAFSQFVTVESFFAEPVKLHAWFNTAHPTQMLFPITGRHSDQPIVFLGSNGQYLSNAPVLNSVQPLRDALQSMGLY
jgi:hypothetical protein